jgi:hypothetical protein
MRRARRRLYHELALLPDESDLPHLKSGEPISSRDQADLRVLLPAREDFGPRLAAQAALRGRGMGAAREARHLPEASRDAYVREHGQRLVRRGDAGPAVRFFEETGGKEPQWLAQAQVDAVRWDDRHRRRGSLCRAARRERAGAGGERTAEASCVARLPCRRHGRDRSDRRAWSTAAPKRASRDRRARA